MKAMIKGRAWYAKRSKFIRENWTWCWAAAGRTIKSRRRWLTGMVAR